MSQWIWLFSADEFLTRVMGWVMMIVIIDVGMFIVLIVNNEICIRFKWNLFLLISLLFSFGFFHFHFTVNCWSIQRVSHSQISFFVTQLVLTVYLYWSYSSNEIIIIDWYGRWKTCQIIFQHRYSTFRTIAYANDQEREREKNFEKWCIYFLMIRIILLKYFWHNKVEYLTANKKEKKHECLTHRDK